MKTKCLIVLCFLFLLAGSAHAAEVKWRTEKMGPTFAEMVKEAQNVVFGQVTALANNGVKISIAMPIKGKAHDEIKILGFKERKFNPIDSSKGFFEVGQDYFFFLKAGMVGTVPYEPTANSIDLKVDKGKISVSIISPRFKQYYHTLDYDLFLSYLNNLVKVQAGDSADAEFLGKLTEKFEQLANSKSPESATYLQMILDLNPKYDNENALFSMLESDDVNNRIMAIQVLSQVYVRKAPAPVKSEEPKEAAKKGAKKEAKPAKKAVAKPEEKAVGPEKIYVKILEALKTDKARVVRSYAAKALSVMHAQKAIHELAALVDGGTEEHVELCEISPAEGVESTLRSILRAIIEFDDEETLDVLEKELMKNKVESFRAILEIFREYSDQSLNLLLLDLLQDANFLPRQVAILEYFRSTKDDETIKSLQDLFVSPEAGSEFIRKSIIEVFADFREKKTVPFIIEHGLHDKSPVVRQAAARSLGEMNATEAVEEFQKIYMQEANRLAREFYVEALAQIRSQAAYECLNGLLEKETDNRMRQQIKFALKKSRYLSQ